jgi:hypothetical protein
MPDAVSTQTLLDGERLVIQKFTNQSDGTGETNVPKIIPANLSSNAAGQACTGVKINKIWFATHGLEVLIRFGGATPGYAFMLPQNMSYEYDFSSFGGLTNNATTPTGTVTFTTEDASNGDGYTVIIEAIKTYG